MVWWTLRRAVAVLLRLWECGLRMETQTLVHRWGGQGKSVGAVIATCLNLNMHNKRHCKTCSNSCEADRSFKSNGSRDTTLAASVCPTNNAMWKANRCNSICHQA